MAFSYKNVNKNIAINQTSLPKELIELPVIIDKFLYADEESGYYVGLVLNQSKKSIHLFNEKVYDVKKLVIVGSSLLMTESIVSGQELILNGYYELGREADTLQFKVDSFIETVPTKLKSIESFLSSGKIAGIGVRTARKIIALFGDNSLTVIDEDIRQLLKVDSITEKKLQKINESWQEWKSCYKFVIQLKDYGVSDSVAIKIFNHFGQLSYELVASDPFKLTEVPSVGFKTADLIAQKNGIAPNDPKRIQACILFCLEELIESGHTAYSNSRILEEVSEIINIEYALIKSEINFLIEKKLVVPLSLIVDGVLTECLSHYKSYGVENRISKEIFKLINSESELIIDVNLFDDYCKDNSINLDISQMNAAKSIFSSKVSILTGGPGTGKTHTIKTILSFIKSCNDKCKVILSAPTGRAAKRMQELSGVPSSTIHRLLGFKEGQFIHNEYNKLKGDLFIVDESSMIDIWLANAFLKALPSHAMIIFVGDTDQLPPVGAGNFFRDIIASKVVPVSRLSNIHRQSEDSRLVVIAHDSLSGIVPSLSDIPTTSDFRFIRTDSADQISELIPNIITDLLLNGVGPNDIQVLTPKRESNLGTSKLNEKLKVLFNPTSFNGKSLHKIHVGDRVMQTKNNRDLGVYNGDIGLVVNVDVENSEITALFENDRVIFNNKEAHDLVLSYAVTVHKSQGSDFPYVIIPITKSHSFMWDLNLFYTAITRAKRKVILVGEPQMIEQAIRTKKNNNRVTVLPLLLTKQSNYFKH